jgi:hypothetical protein
VDAEINLPSHQNLSGEPKAHPINSGAEPYKLSPSTIPTYYSIYPVIFKFSNYLNSVKAINCIIIESQMKHQKLQVTPKVSQILLFQGHITKSVKLFRCVIKKDFLAKYLLISV